MFGTHLFPGGVHPREGKNGKAVNSGNAIVDMPAPARVVIPLSQHIGAPAKAVVKKGDHVKQREVLGTQGNSGRSTGFHEHYEVLINNRSVDPYKFINYKF